jgi:hypothetical protein
MAASFAMALDIPVDEFIHMTGHDGSEIVCPAPEPGGRRGFHSQECISIAFALGFAVTEIELFPASQFPKDHKKMILFPADAVNLDGNWDRFTYHVHTSRGVIAGRSERCYHAVAYENGLITDPAGINYYFTQGACEQRHLYCQNLWRLDRISK